MLTLTVGLNPFSILILVFLTVFALAYLYAMTMQLKNRRTGLLRVLLALGIICGFARELGASIPAPASMSIVCSILFSTAWLAESIEHVLNSNRSANTTSESQ